MNPGDRFGRWLLLSPTRYRYGRATWWKVRCDCGKEKELQSCILRRGNTNSCGCLQKEIMAGGTHQTSHGMTKTPEYRIWAGMKQRCLDQDNPTYYRYGGRGITVHPEFINSFEVFFAEVGPKPSPTHTIERIDNMKGYEPGNLKWATPKEQGRNRRTNLILTINGESHCVAEWAERTGLPVHRILGRIHRGWSPEHILTGQRYARRRSLEK